MTEEYISIIIPVYNDQLGLDCCLQGLQAQTRQEFEVIVVDNDSNPPMHTRNFLSLQVKIITCITKGSYAARNAGITIANGDVVAFLDADCTPIPEWLENGVNALFNSPTKTIVGGDVLLNRSSSPSAIEQYQHLIGFGQRDNIEINKFSATANIFIKRESITEIGLFDERLLSGGDREWAWRAENKGFCVVYCPTALVYTNPRKTLHAAVKQARRVAGGRFGFKQLGLIESSSITKRLAPRRRSWQAISWILRQSHVALLDRVKILGVASLLKSAQAFETLRLRFGTAPERS